MSQSAIRYIVTRDGSIQAAVLPHALWELVKTHVLATEARLCASDDILSRPQPLDAVAELKQFWDFNYPYEASMHCDACGACTDNWEDDPEHPFHLLNANFAGLMVFYCRHCGARIRKKHFWHKVVYECDPQHTQQNNASPAGA